MRYFFISLLLIITVTTGAIAASNDKLPLLNVADLKSLLLSSSPEKLLILDANRENVRNEQGVIAGAKLLTSSSSYDVSTELPASKDTKLVFYCYNERCTASHTAAQRALEAGYKDVAVLSPGIIGWKNSGGAIQPKGG